MEHLNNNDNFYSAYVAPEEFDSYPFLQCQTLASMEGAHGHDAHTFTDYWATVNQQGPSLDSHLVATSYGGWSSRPFIDFCLTYESGLESLSPPFDSYSTNPHGSDWETVSQSTYPNQPGTLSRDTYFSDGQGFETAATFNPSKYIWDFESSKLGYSPIANSPD